MIVCDGGSAGKYNYPCQIGKKKNYNTNNIRPMRGAERPEPRPKPVPPSDRLVSVLFVCVFGCCLYFGNI